MNRTRGRPRGGRTDARDRILEAASARFLASGYGATTLRAVADDARVDVALIGYHFGAKHRLFTEAMALASSPSTVLRSVLDGPPTTFPERLVRATVRTWDDERTRAPLVALVEGALHDARIRQGFEEYIDREVVRALTSQLAGDQATARASRVLTVVIGLIFSRYFLRLPHATRPTEDELVSSLAPLVREALRHHR